MRFGLGVKRGAQRLRVFSSHWGIIFRAECRKIVWLHQVLSKLGSRFTMRKMQLRESVVLSFVATHNGTGPPRLDCRFCAIIWPGFQGALVSAG